jgi:prepilin-type N-terminal cleavage/methylation domain-containing protein
MAGSTSLLSFDPLRSEHGLEAHATGTHPGRPRGFTLTEMLVVMGIITLFIALAVPAVRTLMGTTSISMTRNNISALLVRAREEAIAVQDVRGILFYCDKTTNRLIGVLVMRAAMQDPNINVVLLDTVPNKESMALPPGVRMQMIINGVQPATSAAGNGDRYLGFNPVTGSFPVVSLGGAILFDGNGKLLSQPYGFQMSKPATTVGGKPVASNLCTMLGLDYSTMPTYTMAPNVGTAQNITIFSYELIPGYYPQPSMNPQPKPTVLSQVGIILFDYDAFKSLGFTDQDADIQSPPPKMTSTYATPWPILTTGDGDSIHSEKDEETWLDTNSTPLMVNRFDGSLIRAE